MINSSQFLKCLSVERRVKEFGFILKSYRLEGFMLWREDTKPEDYPPIFNSIEEIESFLDGLSYERRNTIHE